MNRGSIIQAVIRRKDEDRELAVRKLPAWPSFLLEVQALFASCVCIPTFKEGTRRFLIIGDSFAPSITNVLYTPSYLRSAVTQILVYAGVRRRRMI